MLRLLQLKEGYTVPSAFFSDSTFKDNSALLGSNLAIAVTKRQLGFFDSAFCPTTQNCSVETPQERPVVDNNFGVGSSKTRSG